MLFEDEKTQIPFSRLAILEVFIWHEILNADLITTPKPYSVVIAGLPSDFINQANVIYIDLQKRSFR
ncbi:MAG: hypothetical protein GWP19_10130 [Planctomycetia bacterium]|nr:hypothetical protein [Planctomycetia bacterium]